MKLFLMPALLAILVGLVECKYNEYMVLEGHKEKESYSSPLPYTYILEDDLPDSFTWENVGDRSYVTHSLNQHIPQYCGSCWAHGALSALGDRLKVAQGGQQTEELNLSVQYILNCAGKIAGSCHGGSHTGVYEFIKQNGFIPYDTCQVYVACSSESKDGFCPHANFECTPINTCRTCDHSGNCYAVDTFPNATVAEYGTYSLMKDFGSVTTKVKAEIYARGPVAAVVNAEPLVNYQGGIVTDSKFWHMMVNHIVSIVGWGTDSESGSQYWIVRNSWGQYWGELGYFRIIMGKNSLGIESGIAWATPGAFSVASKNGGGMETFSYEDPSRNQAPLAKKLLRH